MGGHALGALHTNATGWLIWVRDGLCYIVYRYTSCAMLWRNQWGLLLWSSGVVVLLCQVQVPAYLISEVLVDEDRDEQKKGLNVYTRSSEDSL